MSEKPFDPSLINISGINHGPIPEPWEINHENAQFLEAVRVIQGCDSWDHTFREIAVSWLSSLDEEEQLNIGAHLDKSSTILSGLIRNLEIQAESTEQAATEIRATLEDLESVHE